MRSDSQVDISSLKTLCQGTKHGLLRKGYKVFLLSRRFTLY